MPALGTSQPGDYQLLDSTGQRKGFRLYYGPVTALTIADLLSELGTLTGTVDALTIGTLDQNQFRHCRNGDQQRNSDRSGSADRLEPPGEISGRHHRAAVLVSTSQPSTIRN